MVNVKEAISCRWRSQDQREEDSIAHTHTAGT